MKKIAFIFSILIGASALAAPVKSMVGAYGTANIESNENPLPDGIVAVEYLESTGTQYINTGIPLNCYTDAIGCSIVVTELVQYGYAFGSNEIINRASRFFGVRRYISQSLWQIQPSGNRTDLVLGTFYDILYVCPSYEIDGSYINDMRFSMLPQNDNYVFSVPIYVFAVNNGGNAAFINKARVYGYFHWRNGSRILDLIPVRVEDEGESIGAMYDLVSGTLFFNAGRGSFIIGPDKN